MDGGSSAPPDDSPAMRLAELNETSSDYTNGYSSNISKTPKKASRRLENAKAASSPMKKQEPKPQIETKIKLHKHSLRTPVHSIPSITAAASDRAAVFLEYPQLLTDDTIVELDNVARLARDTFSAAFSFVYVSFGYREVLLKSKSGFTLPPDFKVGAEAANPLFQAHKNLNFVPDCQADPECSKSILVRKEPHFRFFASCAISLPLKKQQGKRSQLAPCAWQTPPLAPTLATPSG